MSRQTMYSAIFVSMLFTAGMFTLNGQSDKQPIELGKVKWLRNLDQGIKQSEAGNKPVFLLFQEVPGCATCRNYGNNVLSHPLIVEAIEELFVPVAIFNNKGGEDAKVLRYFGEPSWNNPVVRIVDHKKKDIVSRVGGNYSQLGIVNAMISALTLSNKAIPNYLSLLQEELQAEARGTEKATLSMYCFWTGEKNIGQLDGVIKTLPGFVGGREVVTLEFDPQVISYETLLESANAQSCAQHVYAENDKQASIASKVIGKNRTSDAGTFRLDREPKYYLSKTIYQYIPMTDLQATKVNSLIGQQKRPDALLSPRQLAFLDEIAANKNKKWKSAIEEDFRAAWEERYKL